MLLLNVCYCIERNCGYIHKIKPYMLLFASMFSQQTYNEFGHTRLTTPQRRYVPVRSHTLKKMKEALFESMPNVLL